MYFSNQFRKLIGAVLAILLIGAGIFFFHDLSPVGIKDTNAPTSTVFEVKQGDGFREITQKLYAAGLIRSPFTFELFAVLDGSAFHFAPGLYRLSPSMSSFAIMQSIAGDGKEATVTIPEGSTVYDIDRILANALVLRRGDLIAQINNTNFIGTASSASALEGKLFPDTYQFYTDSSADAVIKKMLNNFDAKAGPLLAADPKNAERNLIIASLVQNEVPNSTDQAIVAGIIEKRLAAGMALNIDATICYAKQIQAQQTTASSAGCYPLTANDLKINSPYNTYTNAGLPPTPISNPGIEAIQAALHPQASPYWYYLSDPKTSRTIYARTLQEQEANQARYLSK